MDHSAAVQPLPPRLDRAFRRATTTATAPTRRRTSSGSPTRPRRRCTRRPPTWPGSCWRTCRTASTTAAHPEAGHRRRDAQPAVHAGPEPPRDGLRLHKLAGERAAPPPARRRERALLLARRAPARGGHRPVRLVQHAVRALRDPLGVHGPFLPAREEHARGAEGTSRGRPTDGRAPTCRRAWRTAARRRWSGGWIL